MERYSPPAECRGWGLGSSDLVRMRRRSRRTSRLLSLGCLGFRWKRWPRRFGSGGTTPPRRRSPDRRYSSGVAVGNTGRNRPLVDGGTPTNARPGAPADALTCEGANRPQSPRNPPSATLAVRFHLCQGSQVSQSCQCWYLRCLRRASRSILGWPTDPKGQAVPIPPTMDELIEDLVRRIEQGVFPPGTKIPSGRELADHYDVSPSTIARAIATLRQRGVLVGRPGRGVFVAERQRR